MINKLITSFRKNMPELVAFLNGSAPKFLYNVRRFKDIPVFCFHSAEYDLFDRQLKFLKRNSYNTLNATELLERLQDNNYRNAGNEIVLTFDDGMGSVWATGLPLLEKYDFQMILFVIPGLISEGMSGLSLKNPLSDEERQNVIGRDYSENPLCNWGEIIALHNSGLVDIQSHGMHHMLIGTADTIIDFIHPDYNVYHYGNIHIPAFENEQMSKLLSRDFVLGHPVYKNAPRLKGLARYKDSTATRHACAKHVASNGGEQFFDNPNWREELLNIVQAAEQKPDYESSDEVLQALRHELVESKRIIEERIPGKTVEHFCFPWFQACEESASLAIDAGYKAIYMGATPGFKSVQGNTYPNIVTRLQEEYLLHLPGETNISFREVLKQKRRRKTQLMMKND